MRFLARIFDEFFSGFRAKFQKIVTCVAFSIKFAKTNQKFAENSEFCAKNSLLFKIIHFTPYLHRSARGARRPGEVVGHVRRARVAPQGVRRRLRRGAREQPVRRGALLRELRGLLQQGPELPVRAEDRDERRPARGARRAVQRPRSEVNNSE